MRYFAYGLIALGIVLGGRAARAEDKVFHTVKADSKNLVQFTSQATMETVVGHTSSVTGHVSLNPDSVLATHDAEFEVELNSIDTGIGMRNNDMRKDFLETAKYPKATFKLTRFVSADKPTLAAGDPVKVVAEGDFTVHGVTKPYQIPLTLTFADPDHLTATAEWMVKLADHDIKRPQMLFMRLAEVQRVNVTIALTDTP